KVMLDRDLAALYGVRTSRLNEQVKRNRSRFPEDFMFRLTLEEANQVPGLRSQNATLKRGQHIKYAPYAFTQEGVAMLSSVLHSERAVRVNIAIMRAFVKLREVAATHQDLAQKLDALEGKYQQHDVQIKAVFEAIRKLIEAPATHPKRRIGFLAEARLRS
ncbi:MAG TPA: ORF6N domain-containing protein, partial [Terriglobia bacterium]|nr:ORF6N domain-containing protein [Terriglobia bacterium]